MEVRKHKWGILVLILCLFIILVAIWYCLFGFPGDSDHIDGTLVQILDEMIST